MKATHWFMLITAVIVIGLDIWWASNGIAGDTISEVMLRYGIKHPAIVFALGYLCGHLTWGQKIKEENK